MRLEDGTVRKLRHSFNLPGHAHELTFSCHQRLPLLNRDRTRQWFIEALDAARKLHGFQLWAYVIMPEHAHVLLFSPTDDYSIPAILKSIKQPVARRATEFLRKQFPVWLDKLKVTRPDGRIEHRFWQQGGGYDRNMFGENTIHAAVDYIHNNPVRRGLVTNPLDWAWSSAQWYAQAPHIKLALDVSLLS